MLSCASGGEALEKVNADVMAVILDIKMQGKDGFETMLGIKTGYPQLPVIFHSAYQDLKDPYEIMNDYRPFGYIVKEGNFRILLDSVRSAVEYFAQIQESVRLAEELRVLNENLEAEVEARTETIRRQNFILEKEISLARNVQRSLLPRSMPALEKARVAFRYRPVLGVGGDFIDTIYDAERGLLGLFLCDVSGHGVHAAFLTAMIKMSLAPWGHCIDNPAKLLNVLFHSMKENMGDNFITSVVGCLDLNTGRLLYSNAGHPELIRKSRNGRAEPILRRNGAIFPFNELHYDIHEVQLEPGDIILAYTDGLFEGRDKDGGMLEEAGLLKMMTQSDAPHEPEDLCEYLIRHIEGLAESGGQIEDDISFLAVQFLG